MYRLILDNGNPPPSLAVSSTTGTTGKSNQKPATGAVSLSNYGTVGGLAAGYTSTGVLATSIISGESSACGATTAGGGNSVCLNTMSACANTTVGTTSHLVDPNNTNTIGAGSAGASIGGSVNVLSEIEAAILRSSVPIDVNETEEITVNGERGIWANKAETINFRGVIPISHYAINDDPNPEIIRKKTDQKLVYQQEVAIRYLRPPTPPPPG